MISCRQLLLLTIYATCFFSALSSCSKEIIIEECDKSVIIENHHAIEGYSDKESYFPGDSIHLKIHSTSSISKLEIFKHGVLDLLIETVDNIPCARQDYNCRSYSFGCDWETTYSYLLPSNLESGIYSAKLTNDLNEEFYICFVVKGFGSKPFAVLANTNTWQAYNSWGGHSFYQYDLSEENHRSEIVSFDRPNIVSSPIGNKGHLTEAELHLLRWMDENDYDYHVISDRDLHDGLIDLSNYEALVLNVHPEYWTRQMREHLQLFIETGGNLINLGANGIYWKSVVSRRQIERVTAGSRFYLQPNEYGGKWRDLDAPESSILGVEYDRKGYATYHPYVVNDASHWIFSGTNLNNGENFGVNSLNGGAASGHETDKMTKYSPSNTVLLAKGSNPDGGGASMAYYQHSSGAQIFSAGSITFTGSLSVDSLCHKIALNVFDEFKN